MSNYWAGYEEFGLIIPSDEVPSFVEAYNKAHPEEEIEDPIFLNNETLPGCQCTFDVVYLDSELSGLTILPINGGGWFNMETKSLFIYAGKNTSAYQLFEHGFYSSKEEVVDEFKQKVGDYLPKDFNYEHYIGDVSYASWA